MRASTKRQGVTLLELLVAILIIGVLIALIFPALGRARERARRTKCGGNLKSITQAGAAQFFELGNRLPSTAGGNNYALRASELLPFLKNTADVFDCPSSKGTNATVTGTSIPMQYELSENLCSYGGNTDNRRQSHTFDVSSTAFAWDEDYPSDLVHGKGIMVGYVDGHSDYLTTSNIVIAAGTSNDFRNAGIYKGNSLGYFDY